MFTRKQLDAAVEMQKLATDEAIKKLKKTDIAKIKKEIDVGNFRFEYKKDS